MPKNAVANFESSVFDRAGHTVVSSGSAEGEQVGSRLHRLVDKSPRIGAEGDVASVPRHAAESGGGTREGTIFAEPRRRTAFLAEPLHDRGEVVGRIANHGVDPKVFVEDQILQNGDTVALDSPQTIRAAAS